MKHIVGFSGGIDSQRCALWVRERYPASDIILTNSNAGGNEDPITDSFIDDYSAKVFPVTRTNAIVADMWETPGFIEVFKHKEGKSWAMDLHDATELTFELMIRIKGRAPSRKAQFCTEKLKIVPQLRWIVSMFGIGGPFEGEDYCRYTGVRRDESRARANTPLESWDEYFDCALYAPLAEMTKQQCFDDVLAAGEEVNPLYSLGFNRVGCAPCINSNKADIVNWLMRRPAMIDKVRGMEQRTGRTFFAPCVPGLPMNNVDQVISWAKTMRGGKQDQGVFPIMHEREGCESKYGLCE